MHARDTVHIWWHIYGNTYVQARVMVTYLWQHICTSTRACSLWVISTSRLSSGQIRGVDHGRDNHLISRGFVFFLVWTSPREEGSRVITWSAWCKVNLIGLLDCFVCPSQHRWWKKEVKIYADHYAFPWGARVVWSFVERNFLSRNRFTYHLTPLLVREGGKQYADKRRSHVVRIDSCVLKHLYALNGHNKSKNKSTSKRRATISLSFLAGHVSWPQKVGRDEEEPSSNRPEPAAFVLA